MSSIARRQPAALPTGAVVALTAAPVALLAVFYAWPLGTLLSTVVHGSTIGDALGSAGLGRVVWFTCWQAVASTALTLVVGVVPAYVLARYRFPGRRVVVAIATVPFMLPTVVVGAAFAALLPESWQGTPRAVIVAHVFLNLAVVVRLTGVVWSAIPTDLTGAARTLGATPWQVGRHVVLPLLRPALWASATVVFLFTFTSFGVVRVLGGAANPTLEVEIARRATQLGDVGGAAVLAVLQLLVLAALVIVSSRLQRRATVSLRGNVARRTARTRRQRITLALTAGGIVVAMGAPVVALVARSFDLGHGWSLTAWRQLLSGTTEVRPGVSLGIAAWPSVGVSLRYAVVAATLATLIGGAAALSITARQRAGRLLDVGTMLPLGTSAVTIGLGMLITFDVAPVDWRASWWLIPVGHSLVATPFVVRLLVPVLRAIPADRRLAASTLGASPTRAWWEVDVRALRLPLLAGFGFAAAISLGEFGATTFLTRTGRETLPLAISRLLGRAGAIPRAQGFALACVLFAVTATVIALVDTSTRDDRGGDRARGS